ncbi:MAG TPA: acyloxyacyl hydrolase [Bacteroidia bacterium]|nr:acyloxyacyl hydrolase [Bacteroidia bacterium]
MARLSALFCLCIIQLSGFSPLSAQEPALHKFAVSAGFHHGFIIPHRTSVEALLQKHINGFEADLIYKTNGTKEWQRAYLLPETGISIAVWDLGNKDQLGKAVSFIPYIDFALTKGKSVSFDLRFGWGISFIEKKFDIEDNHKNLAIGTHFNYSIMIHPHVKWELNDRLALSTGFGLTHFSNGALTMPNLGLNLVTATGALTYAFGSKQQINSTTDSASYHKSPYWNFYAAFGIKEIYPVGGSHYLAYTLYADRSYRISRKSSFGFGTDLFFDKSDLVKIEEQTHEPASSPEAVKIGLHGTYELNISKLSFTFNMGGYLYAKVTTAGSIYHRIGTRYQISDKLFACLNLKTHFGKADYVEWGIGYTIRKKHS